MNQFGVDLMWRPMATYNSPTNTNTGTTFQTLNVTQGATCTGRIAGTTLSIASCSSGVVSVSDVLSGGSIKSGTTITALGTGTGGPGTYTVTPSQSAGSTTFTDTSTLFQSSDFLALSYQSQIKNNAPTFGINPATNLPNPNPNYPFQPLAPRRT